jgi:arginyl-tRNA synthetase
LEPIEKSLIIEMNKFPFVIQQASSIDNPALLAEYLSNLARLYNSYYNACPVLDQEKDYRLIITSLVSDVLVKGMNICHIQIPEKI